jgi:hypothetical protein
VVQMGQRRETLRGVDGVACEHRGVFQMVHGPQVCVVTVTKYL